MPPRPAPRRVFFFQFLSFWQSWWVYESRAYTGSNMLSRITEAALATMVLAVVNQHHASLHTPLQVRRSLPLCAATLAYGGHMCVCVCFVF